jgi:hypothetical protein
MNKVFRAAYVCIFLWFLRRLRMKLSPASEGLPRYIAVVFAGMPEALLIGYSDDLSLIQRLCDESKWAPAICEFDGYGWRRCGTDDFMRDATVLRTPRDRSKNAPGGYEEYDMMVASQYNCTERMMARIARIGTERYFQ